MENGTVKTGSRIKKNSQPAWSLPDPRPASQILAEEALLTKAMLAKVLGYKSIRTIDLIVAEDCSSESPCLKPIYLRRPAGERGLKRARNSPSFKSLRFRREDIFAFIQKMQADFPADLEWKFGGGGER
ncbi:MAG: hypothetical protein V3U53_01160 [bacterium]